MGEALSIQLSHQTKEKNMNIIRIEFVAGDLKTWTENTIYVVVMHQPTGRKFALNRKYELIKDPDFSVLESVPPVDEWEGWFPTYDDQSPSWAKCSAYQKEDFVAKWYHNPISV